LLLATAVLGVLVGIALPAWRHAIGASHAASTQAALYDTLTHNLRLSTVHMQNIVLCASVDARNCNGSTHWESGWISFMDRDKDRALGPGEPIVGVQPTLGFDDVRLRSTSGRTRIVFQPHGGVNAGSNVTFTLCDARGPARASAVIIANSGRMRIGTPSASAAAAACAP
jgi:type IV fimbrial biogenesis protein FimT